MKNVKKVLLDTNFLLMPGQLGVDIFSAITNVLDKCEFLVLDKSVKELEGIASSQRGKHKQAARLALKLLESKDLKIITTPPDKKDIPVDDVIASLAKEQDMIVATQDKGLRQRIDKSLFLRQKRYVMTRGLV